MQSVAGWYLQIIQLLSQIDIFKLAGGSRSDIRRKLFRLSFLVELLGALICEGFDHAASVMRNVLRDKRGAKMFI